MAGRRWAQGTGDAARAGKERPRPSERGKTSEPAAPAGKGKPAGAKPHTPKEERGRTIGADGKPVVPDQMSLDAAKALLSPPKAPWHPLPLAEIGIVLGMIAMVVAVILHNARGAAAGFTLIVVCTAEFSWREHRHGYRSHATILAMTIALLFGIITWTVIGATRNVSIAVAVVTFLACWGLFDRSYVPRRQRLQDEADAEATAESGSAPPTA